MLMTSPLEITPRKRPKEEKQGPYTRNDKGGGGQVCGVGTAMNTTAPSLVSG